MTNYDFHYYQDLPILLLYYGSNGIEFPSKQPGRSCQKSQRKCFMKRTSRPERYNRDIHGSRHELPPRNSSLGIFATKEREYEKLNDETAPEY